MTDDREAPPRTVFGAPAQPPRPARRRGYLAAGIVALVVALCVCVGAVALAPLALRTFSARFLPTIPRQAAQAICPGAVARDTAPTDATSQFTVQPVYAEVLSYATDAASQPTSQRVPIWTRDVLIPFPPMADIFTAATGGMDQWGQELGALDPSVFRCVTRDMQSAGLTDLALKALQAAAKQVPGPHTLVYLVPWISHTFGGASQWQSMLIPIWEADPLDRALPRGGASDFAYMYFPIYHEYFEVARYDRLGSSDNAYLTLLGNMVTDGMADNFAAHMTGLGLQNFGISPDEEARLWAQFKPNLTRYANPDQGVDMIGSNGSGVPNGAGYQIGDHIVASYLATHPGVTFDQLAGMDANTIYTGSGYDG